MFRKWEEHLITYKSGDVRTQIDFYNVKEKKCEGV